MLAGQRSASVELLGGLRSRCVVRELAVKGSAVLFDVVGAKPEGVGLEEVLERALGMVSRRVLRGSGRGGEPAGGTEVRGKSWELSLLRGAEVVERGIEVARKEGGRSRRDGLVGKVELGEEAVMCEDKSAYAPRSREHANQTHVV